MARRQRYRQIKGKEEDEDIGIVLTQQKDFAFRGILRKKSNHADKGRHGAVDDEHEQDQSYRTSFYPDLPKIQMAGANCGCAGKV